MAVYKNGMRLADLLRIRIDELGLTDAAAGERMGTSQANVTRWQGTVVPKPENHQSLRAFLEIDEDTLARLLHAQRIRKPTIQELADRVAVIESEVRDLAAQLRARRKPNQ